MSSLLYRCLFMAGVSLLSRVLSVGIQNVIIIIYRCLFLAGVFFVGLSCVLSRAFRMSSLLYRCLFLAGGLVVAVSCQWTFRMSSLLYRCLFMAGGFLCWSVLCLVSEHITVYM